MSYSFQQAQRAFTGDQISELAADCEGLRFLKLRSLSRKEYLLRLAKSCSVSLTGIPVRKYLQILFEAPNVGLDAIEKTINEIYQEERNSRALVEGSLLSELYQLQSFDWGGLHQNSLEKTIVDSYVKKIRKFDGLCDSIENRLYPSMRSYVLCSWYNHWSSIVIEDVFKDHESVLPAVGLIKKVDFFINGIPFDLKVTSLPEGFVKERRREDQLKPELTLLKQFCRRNAIHFSSVLTEARLLEDLWLKVSDLPSDEASDLISGLKNYRDGLIDGITSDASVLIRWLYENQGVRRFDASNRLFLILAKKSNYFESWKLKRARDLLVEVIHKELDVFQCTEDDMLDFNWEGEVYSTTAKAIVVTQD